MGDNKEKCVCLISGDVYAHSPFEQLERVSRRGMSRTRRAGTLAIDVMHYYNKQLTATWP